MNQRELALPLGSQEFGQQACSMRSARISSSEDRAAPGGKNKLREAPRCSAKPCEALRNLVM